MQGGVAAAVSASLKPGQTNLIRNGDFDLDRNKYIYSTDFSDADAGTIDADVSFEAAHWFSAAPDTTIDTKGSVTGTAVTITTPDFVAGDAGAEIVIEGAGASGANHVTTISGAPGSTTTATLAVAAATNVTNVRIRFRIRPILEDSTDVNADANNATNSALKTTGHSRYDSTINDPDYNKLNGWARLGSLNWLCAPLPKNYFKASTTYIATFIYRLAESYTAAAELAITPFVGLWDNSPGRRYFLQGKSIALTATRVGTPASTISREYFIVFYTGSGTTIGSDLATVANAPANGTFVTNSVYVYLSWKTPPGVIKTEIYRKTGTEYKLVGLPVGSDFRDTNGGGGQGNEPQRTVTEYPPVNSSRPRALIQTTAQNFSPAVKDKWQLAQLSINVPFDYSAAGATGKQWLVIGLPAAIASGARAIEIDRISIDDKFGVFSLSVLDQIPVRPNEVTLSSAPPVGTQGNPGETNYIPPGETACPTFWMQIEVEDADKNRFSVPAIALVNNTNKLKVVNRSGEAVAFSAVVSKIKQVIYEARISNGKILRASASHPCFTNSSDVCGKMLQDFNSGDTILIKGDQVAQVLSNIRQIDNEYVVTFSLEGEEKGFWINSTGGHNRKASELALA